ncbi:APC family permease [Arthrobacter sp. StoSoilB13]|uniref:APC family permease n=1 Tax=Arthrobacter sp. StoSoilB13 TaxID=2830993 RepID=UPI001CC4689D|nr:APC family permease [Arthrobacter sp. StoSoilB13]
MSSVDTEVQRQSQPHLKGNMGFLSLFFSVVAYNAPLVVVVGAIPIMVGSGAGLGTPVSFICAGAILAAFAVGFTRMSKIMPKPGGFYSMITAGLGPQMGLGSGLVAFLGYFCAYAGSLVFGGVVLGELVHGSLNGPDIPWYFWSLIFWAASAVLGYLKVELSAKVLSIFLLFEVVIVVSYDVLVFINGGAGHQGISVVPLSPNHWFDGSFSLGLLFALGMYAGFEVTVLFREEVRDPSRTIPRVTYAVIALATVVYGLSSLLFINSIGLDNVVEAATADPTGSMTHSLQAFGGKVLSDAATVLVNTSTFAVVLAAHNISARYSFNLSADGILPRTLSRVHARHGSPHSSSFAVSSAGLVMLLAIIFTGVGAIEFYTALLGITSFVILGVIFLAGVAVPVYLRRHSRGLSVWSRIVFPSISIVGLGSGLVLAGINFPLLVGGSNVLATILMVLIVGLFVLGFTLAMVYRRMRPGHLCPDRSAVRSGIS